ncbi:MULTISPECIES: hypothetical protein [Bacillaceae]|uniref:hypothetical protein n=1 Tax=Bacillaceae TaxID=186817 RepID=UPI00124608B8|nr:hypothetical protein [Robertmurraya sp. DFI.2.37]MDF1511096.1 hypothetical protein [Robertmurraya sp. DFI.2.37]
MTLASTYAKLIADLERELAEIDRDLAALDIRHEALEARKKEVEEGIDGIKQLRSGLDDGKN